MELRACRYDLEMASVRELMLAHKEALRGDTRPQVGPDVLVEASSVDEVLLPEGDESASQGWRTQLVRVDPSPASTRVERMLALQDLIRDDASVLPLVKSGANPSPNVCLGRAKRNDIVIADPAVSSMHASFERLGDTYSLVDQGSSNGTFHNRTRIAPGTRMPLRNGDCLRFGRRVFYYLTGERLLVFLELRMVRPAR